MANEYIKDLAKRNGVKLSEIAAYYGEKPDAIYRRLRKELDPCDVPQWETVIEKVADRKAEKD